MLWLALVFPRLPLEVGGGGTAGAAVVQRGRVQGVDEVAAAAGLMPGMRLSTARGMLPELRIVERDAALLAREARALEEFACCAGHLTPTVCVAPPATLLLEVGGCLRLFGGLRPILESLFATCGERGLTALIGIAPTPRAAEWLALAQAERLATGGARGASGVEAALAACCLTREAIPALIAGLPLSVSGEAPEQLARLAAFGLRRLGELLALPRAALAQRVGPALPERLAQALGEIPDPRTPFRFPEHFRHALELPGTLAEALLLMHPARRLIEALCGWLAARQAGARACTLWLIAERRGVAPMALRLALAGPSREPARFERLLRERLAQTPLQAPVGEIVLEAGGDGELAELPGHSGGLFERRRPQMPFEVLVERLRARFGEAAVHGLAAVPEHRPECATRDAPLGLPSPPGAASPPRPPWLLREPERLAEVGGRPLRRGEALELLAGPERIESGWWDQGEDAAAGDVRRDYFFARTPRGEWCWIYRDADGWWGQGLGPPH